MINEFIAQLNGVHDLARADRFITFVTPPIALLARYPNIDRTFAFRIESAELPGRTLATFETRTYGPSIKSPYQATYADLNLTLICTGNQSGGKSKGLLEKTFFDDWMELINPSPNSIDNGQYNMAYKEDYLSTIEVSHLDTDDSETYAAKFIDIYPVATNQLSLAWSDESVLRMVVTFAYTRWERVTDPWKQASLGPDKLSTAQKPNTDGGVQLAYPNQGVEEELGMRPVQINGLAYPNQGVEEALGWRE